MIEIKDGVVLKDGKEIGTISEDGSFNPIEGLHHKTAAAVERFLATEGGEIQEEDKEKEPAPPQDPHAGDKTPSYVKWFARNHTPEEFSSKYPEHRKIERP